MSQRPTAAGAHAQKAFKVSNAVRPNALHGDDSESFAVSLQEDMRGFSSRIDFTVTRPAAFGPARVCRLLRWPSTRGRSDNTHTLAAKDEVILSLQDPTALNGCHCINARADLHLRNCSRLRFLSKTTAQKAASRVPIDRLKARAGPRTLGSDQIRSFVCVYHSASLR